MFSNIIDMPSKWIEHVKDFAKSKGMTYRDALKCPECKSSYKSGSGLGGSVVAPVPEAVKDNISMSIKEIAKRGRPKKYATPEEAKKAKIEKTIESNKRKKGKKEEMEGGVVMGKPLGSDPRTYTPKHLNEVVGKGILVAGYKAEGDNGLTHIYPISHAHVLEILKHLA